MSQKSVKDAWRELSEKGEKIEWLQCSEKLPVGTTHKATVCVLTFEGACLQQDHRVLSNDRVSKGGPEQPMHHSYSTVGQKIRAILRSFVDPTSIPEPHHEKQQNSDEIRRNNSQEEGHMLEKNQMLRDALRELLTVPETAVLSHSNLVALQEQAMSQDIVGAEGALQHSGTSVAAAERVDTAERVHGGETEGGLPASGAPSPASLFSTDFCSGPYTFQQFDCQSDYTESTNGFCATTPMNTNINIANRNRVKSTSLDSAFSDFAVPPAASEPWESDTSIFNHSSGSNFFVLPSPTAGVSAHEIEQTEQAGAQEPWRDVPSYSVGSSSTSSGNSSGSGNATSSDESESSAMPANFSTTSMPSAAPAASTLAAGVTSASEDSPLPPGATRSTPITSQCNSRGDTVHAPQPQAPTEHDYDRTQKSPRTQDIAQSQATQEPQKSRVAGPKGMVIQEIDLLVLPTALTDAARDCVHEVLSELGVHVKRVQSSAAALVTQYLTTAMAKQRLVQNSGYLRIMVIETSNGVVSASVVAVESPLQADLPSLNTTASPNEVEVDKAEYVLSSSSYDMTAPIIPAAVREMSTADTAPIARSAVIRVESTAWSTYTEEPVPCSVDNVAVTVMDSVLGGRTEPARPDARRAGREGTAQEVLLMCIQAVMEHQTSLHSPYAPDAPALPHTGAAQLVLQRERSYHAVELDERLYGRAVAARLVEDENAQACAAMAGKEGVSDKPTACSALCSIPVPVLDAVLRWQYHGNHHWDQATHVRADIQYHLLPYLRDVVDRQAAPYPVADTKLKEEDRPMPLFTMPPSSLLQGAAVLQSLTHEALRVFDCLHVRRCGGSQVSAECAVGVVIRQCRTVDDGAQLTEDKVAWLHKPTEHGGDGGNAAGKITSWLHRRDRCVSLLLRQDNSTTAGAEAEVDADTQEGRRDLRIVAEPCTTSRRTCAFKPARSVASLVQAPPPDTACLILPTSATYLQQTDKAGTQEAIGANVIHSSDSCQAAPTSGACARGSVNASVSLRVRGLLSVLFRWFSAVYEVLHYLIFPVTTYYIQYFQADVTVNPATQASAQTVIAVDGKDRGAELAAVQCAQWELLVVTTQSTSSACAMDQNDLRVLKTIPLPAAPTHCEELMALEQGRASTSGPSAKASFPSCVVDLSAVNNTGQRILSIHVVNGAADVTSLPTPETKPAPVFGRKRRAPPMEKKHFVALTQRSYQLLRHRVRLQDRLRTVRTALRRCFFLVLVVLIALHVAVLVEYAYMVYQPVHQQTELVMVPSVPSRARSQEVPVKLPAMQDAWYDSSETSLTSDLPRDAEHFCSNVDDTQHVLTQVLPAAAVCETRDVTVQDKAHVPQADIPADISVGGSRLSESSTSDDAFLQDASIKNAGDNASAAPVVVVDVDNVTVTVIALAPPVLPFFTPPAAPPLDSPADAEQRCALEDQLEGSHMISQDERQCSEQAAARTECAQQAPTPLDLLVADTTPSLLPTFPRVVSARNSVRKAVHSLHSYYNRYLRRHHEHLVEALHAAATYAEKEVRRGAKNVAESAAAQMLYAHAVLVCEFVTANVRYYAPVAYYALHLDKVHRAVVEVQVAVYPHWQAMCVYLEHSFTVVSERAKTHWISARQQAEKVVRDLHKAARSVGAKLSNTLAALRIGPEVVQQGTVLLYAGLQLGMQDAAAGVIRLLQAHKELWRDYAPVG